METRPIHASAIDFNGAGTNSLCYATTSLPVLGGTWTAQVDTSAHPGATRSYLIGRTAAQDPPLNLAGGQLLVKPNSSWIFNLSQATSGLDVYTIPVPNDPALIGATIFTQALIFGGGYELCNATDLVLGN